MSQNRSKNESLLSSLDPYFQQEKICLLVLLAISFVAIFFQLGSRSLENQCYIRYAEVAREMIRSGDWIVPRLQGELFLHKPPLIIWLIALPSALWGKVTPFLARLPSALSAVAVVGLTFYLGKRMFRDVRVGAISGLILLSSKEFFWQARTARADMVLTLFILSSLICFLVAYESSGRKRFWFFILFFVGIALGTLTKGPVVMLFPLGSAVVFLLFKRRLRVLLEPGFWWGWVAFCILILPWILLYLNRASFSTIREHFNLAEILSRPEPFYYYLVEFWPRFAPWSLFLPSAVIFLFRKNLGQRDARLFLISWIGIILALIFPIQNKTYRYLLPTFPALSIILGATFKEGFLSLAPHQKDWLTRLWEISTSILLFTFTISLFIAPLFAWWFTRSLTPTIVSTFILLVGGLLIGYGLFKGKALAKVIVISLLSLMIYETYFYYISREDEKHSPVMKMAETIQSRVKPQNLRTYDFDKSILLDFYLDTVVLTLKSPAEVMRFFTHHGESQACLMSESGYKEVFQNFSLKHLESQPFSFKGRTYCLVTVQKKRNDLPSPLH